MAENETDASKEEEDIFKTLVKSVQENVLWQPEDFYDRAEHRTFEWYVLMFSQEADDNGWHKADLPGYRANKNTRAIVGEVFRAMYWLFEERRLAPRTFTMRLALMEIASSTEQVERIGYHLLARLKAYLVQAKRHADKEGRFRFVPASRRRSPRDRSSFPNPSAPPWASINRLPSKKVQVTCRIDPEIKSVMEQAAIDRDISYSQWLSEAIVCQLLEEGYDAALKKDFRPRQDFEGLKRRAKRPRAALPEPDQPATISANRADKVTSIRFDPDQAFHIDSVRGNESRSQFIGNAAHNFFRSGARLPEPPTQRPRLSVQASVSMDQELLFVISQSAKDEGLSVSEWLRRVASWYIAEFGK